MKKKTYITPWIGTEDILSMLPYLLMISAETPNSLLPSGNESYVVSGGWSDSDFDIN